MRIYSTLSGTKEDFQPAGDVVRMYVCGVTPYDECHIGHAMSYIIFDVIRRHLEYRGYRVRHVQNFTDVDDKIILRARELGIPPQDLAERYIQRYFQDMDALNVRRAHIYPRATQEIEEIIKIVEGLIQKGHAYPAQDGVYFRVNSRPDYGKLSRRTLAGMMAGARVEVVEGKEHPMDFALWKAAQPQEPQWPSPWGPGRPGWHIECTAMSLKYLGQSLDIHGGGQDLIFPHHENESAQSEAFTGVVPLARYWMHNGLLHLGQEKMSKSLGNLISVREALARWSPDALHLFVLGSHYRSPLTFSPEALEAGERAAERLRQAARGGEAALGEEIDPAPYRERFLQAMDDDFNTAQALAALFDLARDINRAQSQGRNAAQAREALRGLAGEVLGLTLEEKRLPLDDRPFTQLLLKAQDYLRQAGLPEHEIVSPQPSTVTVEGSLQTGADLIIKSLVDIRGQLRERKRWDLADSLRARLADLGVALEDTPQGTVTVWKRRSTSGAGQEI